jgi:hypothetical protein
MNHNLVGSIYGRSLYRGPSIDAYYQVSVHLAMQFQRRRILEINQPETRIAYGSHELSLISSGLILVYKNIGVGLKFKVIC